MALAPVNHSSVRARLATGQNITTLPTVFSNLVSATSDPDISLHELVFSISP